MSPKTHLTPAFIIEWIFEEEPWISEGYSVHRCQEETRFGIVKYIKIIKQNDTRALIFENGGMSGLHSIHNVSLPLYSILWRHNIKIVFLLGFCGSLNKKYPVNTLLIPHDLVDFTKSRPRSFIEAVSPGALFFYKMKTPFSTNLCDILENVASQEKLSYSKYAVLGVTEGPRFETESEIHVFKKQGIDCVSFSGIPDVSFARELDMHYAMGLFVSNFAEGIDEAEGKTVLANAEEGAHLITKLMIKIIKTKLKINTQFHNKFWMQRPASEIYKKI